MCSKQVVVVKDLEMNDYHMIQVPEEMYSKLSRAKIGSDIKFATPEFLL